MLPNLKPVNGRTVQQFFIRFSFLTAGTLIWIVSVGVFLAPFDIAPAGVSGAAVILNDLIGTPIGLVTLLGNIPIQLWAWRRFGWGTVASTVYCVVLFSVLADVITPLFPQQGISNDPLLNAIFGGVIGGLGAGLIYKVGGTSGGTSTLARILQDHYGAPLSTTYLYANLIVVAFAGLVFGWEGALYAIVALAAEGAASDYILEGPSVVRNGIIVTNHPKEVSEAIMTVMQRGVTSWQAVGMYTGQERTILLVTVARFQIDQLRQLVASVDPQAFLVIGQAHVAYGQGFLKPSGLLDDPNRAQTPH
ncbi:MAG: YitT family protein [Anaerolineae bacterium]|nr:YitT family protein [Anaerolineae bacterium]